MGKSGFIGGNQGNRADYDFYPTPPYAVFELLSREIFEGSVWECACGNGAISEVLKSKGFNVYSSDITDRGYGEQRNLDFLDDNLTKNIRADNIITNPPFKSAQKFIEKALTIATKKVVILQRLAFLESKERYKLFTTTPLKCIYVFSKRLNFYPNGIEDKKKSGMLAFAWFVWEQGYNKKPYINWIKGD